MTNREKRQSRREQAGIDIGIRVHLAREKAAGRIAELERDIASAKTVESGDFRTATLEAYRAAVNTIFAILDGEQTATEKTGQP